MPAPIFANMSKEMKTILAPAGSEASGAPSSASQAADIAAEARTKAKDAEIEKVKQQEKIALDKIKADAAEETLKKKKEAEAENKKEEDKNKKELED